MTAPELRQEIIEAMKSVAWCDDHAKRLEAVEVEASSVMEAVERYVAAMSAREGIQDDTQYCAQCDEAITDWKYAVEGNDGNPVCGSCDQSGVDSIYDLVRDAREGKGGK